MVHEGADVGVVEEGLLVSYAGSDDDWLDDEWRCAATTERPVDDLPRPQPGERATSTACTDVPVDVLQDTAVVLEDLGSRALTAQMRDNADRSGLRLHAGRGAGVGAAGDGYVRRVPTPPGDLTSTAGIWATAPGAPSWLNPPVDVTVTDGALVVTAAEGSDLWRETSYGFVHDSGHALLAPFPDGTALEVAFLLDYGEQFDQAGVLVRTDERTWTKAGVEVSDGEAQLGAVVTRGQSDWSVAPVPGWVGREVTVRASRSGNALTVRARAADGPWRLVRVAPLDAGGQMSAGPFLCAPTRAGLTVRFTRVVTTPADASLHPG